MGLIALASAKGSPGVTTATLALATVWPQPPVLIAECDPAGGDILPGYLRGQVEADRGLYQLVLADRRRGLDSALPEHLLALDDGRVELLPGITGPGQAGSVSPLWDRLGAVLTAREGTVLADCGRLTAPHAATPLLRHADVVAVLLRPTLPGVAAARWRLELLRAELPRVSVGEQHLVLVLTGNGDYPAADVARALATPVAGSLPGDPRTAEVFSHGEAPPRGFTRAPLMRSARALADALIKLTTQATATREHSAAVEVRS